MRLRIVCYVTRDGIAFMAYAIIPVMLRICYHSNRLPEPKPVPPRKPRPQPWLRQFASAHAVAGRITIH